MNRLWRRSKNIGYLRNQRRCFRGFRKHLKQRSPEPGAVTDREGAGDHAAASAIAQQANPTTRWTRGTRRCGDELRSAVRADPDHLSADTVFLLEPHLQVGSVDPLTDEVGPEVSILAGLGPLPTGSSTG